MRICNNDRKQKIIGKGGRFDDSVKNRKYDVKNCTVKNENTDVKKRT